MDNLQTMISWHSIKYFLFVKIQLKLLVLKSIYSGYFQIWVRESLCDLKRTAAGRHSSDTFPHLGDIPMTWANGLLLSSALSLLTHSTIQHSPWWSWVLSSSPLIYQTSNFILVIHYFLKC